MQNSSEESIHTRTWYPGNNRTIARITLHRLRVLRIISLVDGLMNHELSHLFLFTDLRRSYLPPPTMVAVPGGLDSERDEESTMAPWPLPYSPLEIDYPTNLSFESTEPTGKHGSSN